MKNKTVAQRMRLVAGVLYGVLCVYQMFIAQAVVKGANLSNAYFTWLYSVAVIIAAGVMCVWMFAGEKVFRPGIQRAVVVATALTVLFELITYSDQTTIINYTLYAVLPKAYNVPIWLYFFMVIRLMLMILAAFFVTSNRENLNYTKEKKLEAEAAKDKAIGAIIDRDADKAEKKVYAAGEKAEEKVEAAEEKAEDKAAAVVDAAADKAEEVAEDAKEAVEEKTEKADKA